LSHLIPVVTLYWSHTHTIKKKGVYVRPPTQIYISKNIY